MMMNFKTKKSRNNGRTFQKEELTQSKERQGQTILHKKMKIAYIQNQFLMPKEDKLESVNLGTKTKKRSNVTSKTKMKIKGHK